MVNKKVQALSFNPEDPFANFEDRDYYDNMGIYTSRYQDAVINRISTGPTTDFDISQPCKVCEQTGHTFDNCPILTNTPFLRRHYISMKLYLSQQKRREQEALNEPTKVGINKIEEEEIEFTTDANERGVDEGEPNFQSEDC